MTTPSAPPGPWRWCGARGDARRQCGTALIAQLLSFDTTLVYPLLIAGGLRCPQPRHAASRSRRVAVGRVMPVVAPADQRCRPRKRP